jgi:hypothetical protein
MLDSPHVRKLHSLYTAARISIQALLPPGHGHESLVLIIAKALSQTMTGATPTLGTDTLLNRAARMNFLKH